VLDLLLRGGTVVDGTGTTGTIADVGVADGRIVSVGGEDQLARTSLDVTDSALRRAVMGDDAVGSPATPDQIARMTAVPHDALAAGAMGFSTSTAPPHNDGDGHPVPSRAASTAELLALAEAVSGHPGTTLELILAGSLSGFNADEIELMTQLSRRANRPVNWNVLGLSAANRAYCDQQLDASTQARRNGARVVALTLPPGNPVRITFLTGAPLDGLPGWREVIALPVPERIKALGDPSVRRRLLSDAPAQLYRLHDRGRISPGYRADLVVLDPQTFGYGPETTRHDLPGGAWRLYTGSVGVERVYVNGTAVVSGGRLTGATPGNLLRSGRDTHTVTVRGGA
jgi:N-acyl-D-aspartate/D-glutamate deacylase